MIMEVSVIIPTYNHEKYISEAIESALIQKTDFDYEIIVGEDCSKDRTREIVRNYQKHYPDIIKVIYWDQNVGLVRNFATLLLKAKGKFIATLAGDDFWTDPYKLQKQRDFLSSHDEFSLYGVNAIVVHQDTKRYIREGVALPQVIRTGDLFLKNPFIASQNMFLNVFESLPDEFFDADTEDRQLYMLLSQYGDLYFNPVDFGGVYRVHGESITNSRKGKPADVRISRLKERIRKNSIWNEFFENRYEEFARKSDLQCYEKIFKIALRNWKFRELKAASEHIPYNYFSNRAYNAILFCVKSLL